MRSTHGRRVTIRDVAESAGVSITTVSHALNNKGDVSEKTQHRVRSVASELGYRPSRAAQAMRGHPPKTIALVLPDALGETSPSDLIGLDYYLAIASGAASAAFACGNSLLLPPPLDTRDEWRAVNPDGAILCDPIEGDTRILLLESLGIPVVTIEADAGRLDRPYFVAADTAYSTVRLLDHLRAAGAEKIALLCADATWSWAIETRRAYEGWCLANRIDPAIAEVSMASLEKNAHHAASRLLDGESPPDAFFASAERFSTGALQACRERGIRVPEDVLVVGGVDGSSSRLSSPPITAVDPFPHKLATAAVQMLVKLIHGEAVHAPVTVSSTINLRASSLRLSEDVLDSRNDSVRGQ